MKFLKVTLLAVASLSVSLTSGFALPAIQSPSAPVLGVRLQETAARLYVTGAVKPLRVSTGAHVEVQLIDAAGSVLAERSDAVAAAHPRTAAGRAARAGYTVSFPRSEAGRGAVVRVAYHGGATCCS